MFRRRRRDEQASEPLETDSTTGVEAADEQPEERWPASLSPRPDGPWDESEVEDPAEGRIDLGGLLIPGVEGMELRVEVSNDVIVAATVVLGQSALQLQAFAAPRSEGIWREVLAEIAQGVHQQSGRTEEVEGAFGPELRAIIPVQLPDGTSGAQAVRFVGVDGPRWLLRGVFSGLAAVQPETATTLERVLRGVVVRRGGAAMAPRDPILLRLPENAVPPGAPGAPGGEARSKEGLNPFQRGPEITELR